MPFLEFKNVEYHYIDNDESFLALEDIDLTIDEGEFVCLVGHSGCGKSTMLSLIAGLAKPTKGEILIDGKPIEGPGLDRSLVFQSYSLFPWLTAVKNVVFALRKAKPELTKEQAHERALELLDQVEVKKAADRYPFQLSGGMRQRVAIARALAIDAPVMLLDEPFGALDPMIRGKLQTLLLDLWAGTCCKTAVFVTHDIDEALILADRIVFMEPRHIIRQFELPKDRDHSMSALYDDPALRAIKEEVLDLFEQTAQGEEDE